MGDPPRNPMPEPPRQPTKAPPRPPPPPAASNQAPLSHLIRSIEQICEACYACDRVPLEDMLGDLRRWSVQLAPEVEASTVQERLKARASRSEGGAELREAKATQRK